MVVFLALVLVLGFAYRLVGLSASYSYRTARCHGLGTKNKVASIVAADEEAVAR
jgi:hypothetical protein